MHAPSPTERSNVSKCPCPHLLIGEYAIGFDDRGRAWMGVSLQLCFQVCCLPRKHAHESSTLARGLWSRNRTVKDKTV